MSRCRFVPAKSDVQPEGLHRTRGMAGSGFPPLSKIPHCCLPEESGPCLSPSVAGRPLKPATDRGLGEPLPHQLANLISAAPIVRGLAIPPFPPSGVCGISNAFEMLTPATGHVPISYYAFRHSPPAPRFTPPVPLACVKQPA